jgi:predicted transglutaminase-like cysteine proteinase
MAEFSRGGFIARSTGIVVLAAMLYGAGTSAQAQSAPPARYFTINQVLAKLDSRGQNAGQNQAPAQLAALAPSAPIADTPARPAPAPPQGEEPFGLITFRAPEGALWVKWRKLESELQAEAEALAQCQAMPERCASPAAQKYLALIAESRKLSGRGKIDRINRAINAAVRYTSDLAQHGVLDLWSAPLATLASGQGDCEDYAIAKYVALRAAGFAADDLRLVLVRDRQARQDHAVAGVRHDGRWLMLDNRHDVLLENKDAWHFTPLFALDREGVKLFAAPYAAPAAQVAAANTPTKARGPAAAETRDAADANFFAAGEESLELRVDTFDTPPLRGRL